MNDLSHLMFDETEADDIQIRSGPSVDASLQELAEAFGSQVDLFYSLPREPYERKRVTFSPSGVSKCARELYYINTNAPEDVDPLIPWRVRMSRNGTGAHDITQADYLKMDETLRAAGYTPQFKFLEAEIEGEKSYDVGGYVVTLKGRCDGKIGLLDADGNVVQTLIYEKKTKDKRKNLNRIIKAGAPQPNHRAQAVAYALIFGVNDVIFEYESLQKPDWSELEPDKPDQVHFYVRVSEDEKKTLLIRLAGIVEAIESGQLPAAELDKCGFCKYKTICSQNGGYGC